MRVFGLIVASGIVGIMWFAAVAPWSILGTGLIVITISLFVLSLALISFFTDAVTQPNSETVDSSKAETALVDEDSWYVLVNGKELGPAPFDGLVKFASSGVLPKDVKMRRARSEHFLAAGDIPGLFPTTAASEGKVTPPRTSTLPAEENPTDDGNLMHSSQNVSHRKTSPPLALDESTIWRRPQAPKPTH